jgi:hypothetical protein
MDDHSEIPEDRPDGRSGPILDVGARESAPWRSDLPRPLIVRKLRVSGTSSQIGTSEPEASHR